MQITKSIKYEVTKREAARDRVANLEQRVENHRQNVEYYRDVTPAAARELPELSEHHIEALTDALADMLPSVLPLPLDFLESDLFPGMVQGIRDRATSKYSAYNSNLRTAISNYQSAVLQLQQAREALELLPEDRTEEHALEDIRRALDSVPTVLPGSVYLVDNTRICWITTGLAATVNGRGKPYFVHVPDNTPYTVLIPPTHVHVDVETGNVVITPVNAKGKVFSMGGSPETPHPHVINGVSPCLGDFAGPVREAVDMKDWGLMAELIGLFLQQINSDDAAGKYWYTGFVPRFGVSREHLRSDDYRAALSTGGYAHFFYHMEGVWEMKASQWDTEYQPFAASA